MSNTTKSPAFSRLHPAVLAFWFLAVLVLTMFVRQPAVALLSLAGGWMFRLAVRPHRMWQSLLTELLFFLLITLTNPLFSHNGRTVLAFVNGRAYTLEGLIYGGVMAAMLLAVVVWCGALTSCFGDDKLLYLFGRASPKTALLLSMALHLIPRFRAEYRRVRDVSGMLCARAEESFPDRVRHRIKVFSSLITRSLERSVTTGISMKSRGYGMARRTSYTRFRFGPGDAAAISIIAVLTAITAALVCCGVGKTVFYPSFSGAGHSPAELVADAAFGGLCFLPVIIEIVEKIKWNCLLSKI